jgi:hypothetical protein
MSLIDWVRTLFGETMGIQKSLSMPKRSLPTPSAQVAEASRLILTELLRAREAAKTCIERKEWWPANLQPTTKAWGNLRRTVVLEFSIEDWSALVCGFEAVDNLMKEADRNGDDAATLTDEARERIIPLLTDIERGCTVLARYVLSHPGG